MPDPLDVSVGVPDLLAAMTPAEQTALARGALDPREVWYEFVTLEDDRVRPSHRALHGTVWKAGDPNAPVPPLDYGCFLPGQRIRGVIDGAMRAQYQGQAVEITLQSGCTLRLTVNHPVVTDHGLVPAGTIQPGWKCRTNPRYVARAAGDHENDMPTVEEAFDLVAQLGAVGRRDVGRDDFHGDGQACHGEIEVVGSYGVLRNAGDAQPLQHAIDRTFPHGEAGGGLPRPGLSLHAREAGRLAGEQSGRGEVSGSGLPRTRRGVHAPPLGALCLGLPAQLDVWGQQATDCGAGDAQAFGERIDGLPLAVVHSEGGGINWREMQALACGEGAHSDTCLLEAYPEGLRLNPRFLREGAEGDALPVAPDEVREVRVFQYSGHVYDFRSPVGWILCNGAAVSNCRCSIRYVAPPGSRAARKGLLPPSPQPTTDTVPAVYAEYLKGRLPGFDLPRAVREVARLPPAEQLPTLVEVLQKAFADLSAGQARDLAQMALQARREGRIQPGRPSGPADG